MMALEKHGFNDLPSTWYEFVRQRFYKVVKWFHRKGNQNMLFVFVGLEGSGKTTAIQNMFGKPGKPGKFSTSLYVPLGTQITSPKTKVTILDVKSLYSLKMVDQNAKLLASFKKYLKCKGFVPTVVFITARLTDERFAGESSEFVMALKSLYLLKDELTDISCSNVVLLLTFANELGIRSQRMQRAEAYKKAFYFVFGTNAFTIILDNTPISSTHNMWQIPDRKDNKISCFQGLFFDYVNSLPEAPLNAIGSQIPRTLPSYEAREIKLDYDKEDHLEILQFLNFWNGVADRPITKHINIPYYDVNACATAVIPADCLTAASFGDNKRYEPDIILDNVYNLVPRNASILLENGKYKPIKKCVTGQKIFSVNGGTSVITKIIQIFGSGMGRCQGPIQFGNVYMKANNISDTIQTYTSEGYYSSVPKEEGFSVEKITNLSYFYVEVNGGNYPFVVDERVCFSYCKREIESGLEIVTSEQVVEGI